jgi:3-oxoadipate enol-lactonase
MDVNGVSLRHALHPGTGPTLVLIHEMGGSLESWEEVIEELKHDFRVLRYDVRGAGMSGKIVAQSSLDEHADDLEGLLSALDLTGPVALAGIAVGAAIAMRYASTRPERISHLLALAPACGVAAQAVDATLALAHTLAREGLRPAGEALLDKAYPVALQTDPVRHAAYRSRWLASDPRSLASMLAMLASLDMAADLARLPVRTVLVGGSFDALRPPAEIARLAALAPQAESVIVPTGHMMATHSPRLLAHLLDSFVAEGLGAAQICECFLADTANRVGEVSHAA